MTKLEKYHEKLIKRDPAIDTMICPKAPDGPVNETIQCEHGRIKAKISKRSLICLSKSLFVRLETFLSQNATNHVSSTPIVRESVKDDGFCVKCKTSNASSEKQKKEHKMNVSYALKQLPSLGRIVNTKLPIRLERSVSSCEANGVSWISPGIYVWISRAWLTHWRYWIGGSTRDPPIWPPPELSTWKCKHNEFVIPPRLDAWIRSNVSGSQEDVEEMLNSQTQFEPGELLASNEFDDIKKQFEFNSSSTLENVETMPTFFVDVHGLVTMSTRCDSCFEERKVSYEKSVSEFKQVVMKFTFLPPGQSPMGVVSASPSSRRASGRRRPTRRTSIRVSVSSSDKIGVIKYRILNQHCFSTRSVGNSSANEWVRLMSETSAADMKDDLRVSEAGIRLDQRFYYTVITVDVMPDVADYLTREETAVERGFAGTAFVSSGPMEVVEILE